MSAQDETRAVAAEEDPTRTMNPSTAPAAGPVVGDESLSAGDAPMRVDEHAEIPSDPGDPGADDPDATEDSPKGDRAAEQGDDVRRLADEIAALSTLFDQRASEYEKTIRGLHARVEDLQRSQLMGLMKPVFVQFADLHSEMVSTAQQARQAGDDGQANDLDYFANAFERMLGHFDLESVGAVAGDPFDRRSHAAVLTKKTTDQAADQTVARVVRQGFRVSGEERVLIPARVIVWKAVEPSDPASPPSGQPTPAAHVHDGTTSAADAGEANQDPTERNDGELS